MESLLLDAVSISNEQDAYAAVAAMRSDSAAALGDIDPIERILVFYSFFDDIYILYLSRIGDEGFIELDIIISS